MSNTFTLRLAEMVDYPADRLTALETQVATGPKIFVDQVDLIARNFSETVPQGSLFAYLFRRFGFPNRGSDPHKDLCSYMLTTAHPGMLMSIMPSAGGDSSLSIRFLVPFEVAAATRDWETRHKDAHEDAFLTWVEKTGQVPDWAEDAVAEVVTAGMPVQGEEGSFRRTVSALHWITWQAKREERTDDRVAWHEQVRETFADLHPDLPSGIAYRDPDPEKWDENDPLAPYAEAIAETMAELKRPVWVRDVAIDPWGRVKETDLPYVADEEDDDVLVPDHSGADLVAPAAGYPSGDLGNKDPKGFGELHAAILKAGGGDAARGIAHTLELLRAENNKTTSRLDHGDT